ncbi:hypothetical protein BU16DRAFT_532133 [Lophium mytilinum]|uniref:Ubiquitin interaction motif protein n=1 Tax=Lophium mytilinum TaxID=390894 RepID=A0A6A6Q8L4_9PEZI|nr:hypothetical protein BU16DRAFT_532133 [Lophium mytilinum]
MDDNVANLIAILPVTDAEARQLLRENNNNPDNAISQYFDKGAPTGNDPDKYDDSLFAADREGFTDGTRSRPPFHIDGGIVGDYSTAPTRPPSRISDRSMADSGTGMSNVPIKSVEGPGQESGVIGGTRAIFGPAPKDAHYDAQNWAMTLVGTQEKVIDVAADQRKREAGGPAFLKPIANEDFLPSLVTMLSTVPSIRNLLLCPGFVASDYGQEEDWWRGTPITPPARIAVDGEPIQTDQLELIREVQRLIAFLDRTDRAYGSAEALSKLEAFTNAIPQEPEATSLEKFLLGWERAVEISGLQSSLQTSLHTEVIANGAVQNSHFLDATVVHNTPGEKVTLYDVLDSHLFTYTASAYVKTLCDVMVIRLSSSDGAAKKLDVEIPGVFFADRYMACNEVVVSQMLRDAAHHEEKITVINRKINKIKYHHSKKTGKTVESLKLLNSSIKAFETLEGPEGQVENANVTLQELQKIYNSIEVKLKELDEQKRKTREILDDITGIFKPPGEKPSPATNGDAMSGIETTNATNPREEVFVPKYKQTLCAVSTEPNTIYLRNAVSVPDDKRWWRIQYQYDYDSPLILREQVTEEVVLKRASDEHKEALLIYASDEAITTPPLPLPKPLEDFVNQDNLQFLQELQKVSEKPAWDDSGNTASNHNAVMWDGPYRPNDADADVADFANLGARAWLENAHESSATLTPNSEMTETNGEVREIGTKEIEHIEVLPKE